VVKLINYIRGYVRIRVWGVSVERFINLCGNKNILLWDVVRDDGYYEMNISLSAFYELRSVVRKTSTRVVILKRYGLPFLLKGFRKRKTFVFGAIATVFLCIISSLFLWDVSFEGNFRLTDEVIMDFLQDNQVHIGMFKSKLDIELLEKELRKTFKEITWTSMKLEGSRLYVSIKENDAPIIESNEYIEKNENGIDIVSEYQGKVISIVVRKGVPMVSVGEEVEAGTVLVEGKVPILNEDKSIKEYLLVESDADILLEHSLEFEESLPLYYTEKVYTGREKRGFFLRWDKKEVQVIKRNPFFLYDEVTRAYQPVLFEKVSIPLYVGSVQQREYYYLEKKYSKELAEKLLSEKLVQFINSLSEKGVQIIEKNVTINRDSSGWSENGILTVREPVNFRQPTITENNTDVGE